MTDEMWQKDIEDQKPEAPMSAETERETAARQGALSLIGLG